MSKDKLGVKRTCPNCDGKFYDLNKDPLVCPLCSTQFKLEDIIKKRGESKVSAKDIDLDEGDDIIMPSNMDDNDDIVEDTSDLGDDNDDMSDVIDNIERDDNRDDM